MKDSRAVDRPVIVVLKRAVDLSDAELRSLRRLTLQKGDVLYGLLGSGALSDMAMLLNDVEAGKADTALCSLAMYDRSYIVGWASIETWHELPCLDCYVDKDWRGGGIGKTLVRELWPHYKARYNTKPFTDSISSVWFRRVVPEMFELADLVVQPRG